LNGFNVLALKLNLSLFSPQLELLERLEPLEQASNGRAVGTLRSLPMSAGFTPKAGGYP
jgi:hypothetical protein